MSKSHSTQLPPRVKDETGNVYGKLTVLSYAGSNVKALKGAYWLCLCECGRETTVCGRALRNGTIQSCGCSKHRTDETGNIYGKLTVLKFAGNTKSSDSRWLCQCKCGNTTVVARGDLRKSYGGTKSCGCGRASAGGACRTPEYTTWQEMKRRCYKPNAPYYHIYGGKGITVCDRWRTSFVNFLADMGPKPFPEATIDRVNGDGDYEPANCRWASKMEQSHNSRKARMLTCNGETLCVRAWARKLGVVHRTICRRLEQSWTINRIVDHYRT